MPTLLRAKYSKILVMVGLEDPSPIWLGSCPRSTRMRQPGGESTR